MPKTNFSINGWTNQSDISLEVDKINGLGGVEYPHLFIPFELTLRPFEDKGEIKAYSVLWLHCNLNLYNNTIAEGFSEPIAEYSWPRISTRQILVKIPLDYYRIEKIEEIRQKDIQFLINGTALIAIHPSVTRAGSNEEQNYDRSVEYFTTGNFNITFNIPQSQWVEKILPGLGYGKVKIIEIPSIENVIPSSFKVAQEELDQAQLYFIKGDYDKTVEHCRNSLEPLQKKLPEIKNLLSNSKYEWVSEIGQATYEWIDKICKKTRDISSIPHHLPSIGHFSRFESQSILLVTIALLSYCGKLISLGKEKY